MIVEMRDGWLLPVFRYNENIVRLIKTITGRSFDRSTKRWFIPCYHVLETMEKLGAVGFQFTSEVRDYKLRLLEHHKNVARAKEDETLYSGSYGSVLRPYQKKGVAFLRVAGRALLADQMGLGKTLQIIAAGEGKDANLILCPATNKYGWADEVKKWAPAEKAVVIDGSPADRARLWQTPGAKWFIVNYELLLRPGDLAQMRRSWGMIACDEATRISNGKAKTVVALKTLPAKRRYALTGTPISNRPDDIWSIVDWLLPGYLGTWTQFIEQYAVFDSWEGNEHRNIIGFTDLKGLAERLKPVMLRRLKEEVLHELPKKTVKDVVFELSEHEAKVYDAVRANVLGGLQADTMGKIDRSTLNMVPVKMLRLKQVTGHVGLIGEGTESTKLEILIEKIKEVIGDGEKALIFTQFAKMADLISERLNRERIWHRVIQGEVPHADRQAFVNQFQADPEIKAMVMTEAGAFGLNLQAASYVFHFDNPWSLSKQMQREDRAHRMGQTRPVTVVNLIAKGTIDEYVVKVLHKKAKHSVEVLEDDMRLEDIGMSEEDVKAILRI